MGSAVQTITATILIQVGADQPKPIGTIQIPIEVTVGGNQPIQLHNGVSGARGIPDNGLSTSAHVKPPVPAPAVPDDEKMTAEQLDARFPIKPGNI